MTLQDSFIDECKDMLLKEKSNIINRVRSYRQSLSLSMEKRGGDEADQTSALLQEKEAQAEQERLNVQLAEIESALARIEKNSYGICEETGEPIEAKRLLVIPWTALSIEGAEIRENKRRQYAC